MKLSRPLPLRILMLGFFLSVGGYLYLKNSPDTETPTTSIATPSSTTTSKIGDEAALVKAIENRKSGVWCQASGKVSKLLEDDLEGNRHQRFLLRLSSGHLIKVAHNIDLAKRVPVKVGDFIQFCGRFEWNELGGVVHWTHRDPWAKGESGWIEYEGKKYE